MGIIQSSNRPSHWQAAVLLAMLAIPLLILLERRTAPPTVITAQNARDVNPMVRLGNGQIFSMAWSPDGSMIAGAGSIGVWLFDAHDFSVPPRLLKGHTGFVRDVAFHPDGHLLASASDDHTVRLWDTTTWTEQAVFEGHTGKAMAATFSADGRWLASAANDATVRVWDVEARTEHTVLRHNTECVFGLSFHPQRPLLASIAMDGVRLWHVETGEQVAAAPAQYQRCGYEGGVAFNADGSILIAGRSRSYGGTWAVDDTNHMTPAEVEESQFNTPALIYLGSFWPVFMGIPFFNAPTPDAAIFNLQIRSSARGESVAFSPDGTQLAVNSDESWDLWDVESRTKIAILQPNLNGVSHMALSSRNNAVLATDSLSTVLWTLPPPVTEIIHTGDGGYFQNVTFDPLGTPLSVYNYEYPIVLLNAQTGAEVTTLRGLQGPDIGMEFSPNGRLFAATFSDRTAIWDILTGEQLAYIAAGDNHISNFSEDSALLATLDWGNTGVLWNIADYTRQIVVHGLEVSVGLPAVSRDHRLVAGVVGDDVVRLWNVEDGSERGTLMPSRTLVWQTHLRFSPDGRFLAAMSGRDVWVWDTTSLEETVAYLNPVPSIFPSWPCSYAAFSSDSSLIAVGTETGAILLTETATGNVLHTLHGHTGCIAHLFFNPEGTLLVSGSHDGTVRLWRIGAAIQPPEAQVVPVHIPGEDLLLTPTHAPVPPRIPTMSAP